MMIFRCEGGFKYGEKRRNEQRVLRIRSRNVERSLAEA